MEFCALYFFMLQLLIKLETPESALTTSLVLPSTPDCSSILSTLKVVHSISERDRAGSIIVNGTWSNTTKLSIAVEGSDRLREFFKPYFIIQADKQRGVLASRVDVELVYKELEERSREFNITIVDDDDNEPSFANTERTSCAIPGYNAKPGQEYTGILKTEPGVIRAEDGDTLINNSISYSILYGEPTDYHRYFEINTREGYVNKTANITDDDPQDFVILIEATEVSSASKSKVAVLFVKVTKMVTTETPGVTVDMRVLWVLRVASGVIILGFTAAFVVIIRHRMRKYRANKRKTNPDPDERSVTSPRFADLELVKEDSFLKANTIILTNVKATEPVISINNLE